MIEHRPQVVTRAARLCFVLSLIIFIILLDFVYLHATFGLMECASTRKCASFVTSGMERAIATVWNI